MHDVMGIINLSEDESAIKELTKERPIGTIPIAGRYRVIDFTLSNMVNIGIQNVAIFTKGKSRSILEHLGHGREWDLDRKKDGLFIFTPYNNPMNTSLAKGDIKNFKDQLEYLKLSKQKYVILSRSYMICNVNLLDALKYHKESDVDATILYKRVEGDHDRFANCDVLNINEHGKVVSISKNIGHGDDCNVSMEMYIMKKSLFIDIIENGIAQGEDMYIKDALYRQLRKCSVNGFTFDGYLSCINSTENYYRTNMELLNMEVSKELFFKNGYIYTRVKDEPPTKYTENSEVTNSVVANGCIINGTVENSVIFRGVKIGKGAVVKNCVIMQKCVIEEGAVLQHAILDKNIMVSKGAKLQGTYKKPLVMKKNMRV